MYDNMLKGDGTFETKKRTNWKYIDIILPENCH